MELLFNSALILVYLNYSLPKIRNKYWIENYALMRALIVFLGMIFIFENTGTALNPFPVLNGALVSGKF